MKRLIKSVAFASAILSMFMMASARLLPAQAENNDSSISPSAQYSPESIEYGNDFGTNESLYDQCDPHKLIFNGGTCYTEVYKPDGVCVVKTFSYDEYLNLCVTPPTATFENLVQTSVSRFDTTAALCPVNNTCHP